MTSSMITGTAGREKTVGELSQMLEKATTFDQKLKIVEEIGETRDQRAEEVLIKLATTKLDPVWKRDEIGASDRSCDLKAAALVSLGKIGSRKSQLLMQYGLYHDLFRVQEASVRALSDFVKLNPEDAEQTRQIVRVLVDKLVCIPPNVPVGNQSGLTVPKQTGHKFNFHVPRILPAKLVEIAKDHSKDKGLVMDIVGGLIWEVRDRQSYGRGYSEEVERAARKGLLELGELARPYLIDSLINNENSEVRVGAALVILESLDNAENNELLPFAVFAIGFNRDTAVCMDRAIENRLEQCLEKCGTSQEISEFRSALNKGKALLTEKGVANQETVQFIEKWEAKAESRKQMLERSIDRTPVLEGSFGPRKVHGKNGIPALAKKLN